MICDKPMPSDAAAVQEALKITEVSCGMLCVCQMVFENKLLCFALSLQMTLTKHTQSASSRDEEECAGIWHWDFMPQWEWILKLMARHEEGTQRDHFMFPRHSAQRWR